MRNPRLAFIYAKSLIRLAQERNILDNIYKDMVYLKSVCEASSEFRWVVKSPIIKESKKEAILATVLKQYIDPLSWAFIVLVINKGREVYLDEIAGAAIQQYYQIKGIHEVSLTTATPMDDELKNAIVAKLKEETQFPQVKLETSVNPDIIGGFILEYNNNLVDASVARRLHDLKQNFLDSQVLS